jgi:hypothetical protein
MSNVSLTIPGISADPDFGIGIIKKGLNGQYRESCQKALQVADKIGKNEKLLISAWKIAKPISRARMSLAALTLWLARGREVYDARDGVKAGKASIKKPYELVEIINQIIGIINDENQVLEEKSLLEPEYLPTKEDFESAYKSLSKTAEHINIEDILDQIELKFSNSGYRLKNNWRLIIKSKLELWSKK